jgi:hypothetical protein
MKVATKELSGSLVSILYQVIYWRGLLVTLWTIGIEASKILVALSESWEDWKGERETKLDKACPQCC